MRKVAVLKIEILKHDVHDFGDTMRNLKYP